MKRVFLDANILFSVAWRAEGGVGRLWDHPDLELVTSRYALMEAERNIQLKKPVAAERLAELAKQVEVSTATAALTADYELPVKDRPILEAAVGAGCSVLLTGDVTHFGHLMDQEIQGVRVMTVSAFLQRDDLSAGSMDETIEVRNADNSGGRDHGSGSGANWTGG